MSFDSLVFMFNIFFKGPDANDEQRSWEIMSPKDFYTFAIPFEMEGPTKVRIAAINEGELSRLIDIVYLTNAIL